MTVTPLSPSPIAAPVPGRYHTGDGDPPPTQSVSAAFDGQNPDPSLQDHGSDPAHSDLNQRRGDYSTVAPVPTRRIRAYIGATPPETDTTAGANSPRFPPLRLVGRLPSSASHCQ